MGKARVHELAREFGVESTVVLARLKAMGEFVKSASSTVEPHVARKLQDTFAHRRGPNTAEIVHADQPVDAPRVLWNAPTTARRFAAGPGTDPDR